MVHKQGDIVIVLFPFSDLSNIKQRPVLVLSKDINNNSEDVIVCGITSNIRNAKYSVLIEKEDLVEGFIPKISIIKVDKLFTLNQAIIKKKVGRINREIFEKIKLEFAKLI